MGWLTCWPWDPPSSSGGCAASRHVLPGRMHAFSCVWSVCLAEGAAAPAELTSSYSRRCTRRTLLSSEFQPPCCTLLTALLCCAVLYCAVLQGDVH